MDDTAKDYERTKKKVQKTKEGLSINRICDHCGKPFIPGHMSHNAKFCQQCRQLSEYKHGITHMPKPPDLCVICHRPFIKKSNRNMVCGAKECLQARHYQHIKEYRAKERKTE